MKHCAAFALVLLSVLSGKALALDECPAQSLAREDRIKAIEAAETCRTSFDIMDACRYNAGGDVELSEIVIKKCEARFLSKLSTGRRRSYERERKACQDKYAREQGTMYTSFAVTCEAGVAVKYEKRWGRAAAPKL